MKRRLTKLVIFLLLGAVVNVAVVNGLAPWARHPSAEHVRHDLVSLADRYAISIAVQRQPIYVRSSHGTISGYPVTEHNIRRSVPIFLSEFALYPPDFVKNTKLQRIVLCRFLAYRARPVGAIVDFDRNTLYIHVVHSSSSDEYLRRAIHHEFFHIVDFSDDGALRNDEQWEKLNHASFDYGSGGWSMLADLTATRLNDSIPGFLNKYSTSGVEEDKAEVFATMIVDYAAVEDRAKMDMVVRNKVEMMKDLVLHISPDMSADFWNSLPVRAQSRSWVINSIFYAMILWILICGPFALRRLIRRKRGLCVACGYDLRGDLERGCPECGWRREAAS